MRYGFVIDQRACIGCHACTVACKSEHDVPLGVNRTWVKYVEKGEFPNARRHFLVERCNHCENAPCVAICPTKALYQREDGIVDFDKSRCIGCKSCMQACPYDALYIDPDTHTAAKCNFCAHRIDQGLQPACVVVCPEEAIIFGDLDNPTTRISQLIKTEEVKVRRPEQGTEPRLFYVGAEDLALIPEALPQPLGAMWNEPPALPAAIHSESAPEAADHAQVAYNVRHERPWGWRVSAYLLTKSLSAGLFLALAALLTARVQGAVPLALPVTIAAIVFLGLTALLLVVDLKRPERFLYIVFKPQWRSWLTRGTYVLMAYGGLLALWGLADLVAPAPPLAFTWLVALFAALAAVYTAFLFGQAEGRDLWQEPLLPAALLAQALIAGAMGLGMGAALTGQPAKLITPLAMMGLVALLIHAGLIFLALLSPEATANAAWGRRELIHGGASERFWWIGIGTGIVAPLALLVIGLTSSAAMPTLMTVAAIAALIGLVGYEDAFVRAGQAAPLS